MSDSAEIDPKSLPERQAERVRMLIFRNDSEGSDWPLVALDDSDGTFVGLAGIPAMPNRTVLDLSRDGTKILFRSSADRFEPPARLVLLDLATGRSDWFDLSACDSPGSAAALSPDASEIAVLSSHDDRAGVDVIDIASRAAVRLWTGEDETWGDNRITWSPDGELLAATITWMDHEETDDDQDAVVVLRRADGSVRHRYNFHGHIGWLNDRDLGLIDYYAGGCFVVAGVASGDIQPFPDLANDLAESSYGWRAVLDDRVVISGGDNRPVTALFHTDRHGKDVRPLVATRTWPPQVRFAAATDPLRLGA